MNTHPDRDASQYETPDGRRPVADVHKPSLNKHGEKNQEKQGSFFGELFKFAIIAVVIVLPIRMYIAQPFIVSGASMEPTFEHGEYLIVDEISYRFISPERGDVIIFRFPEDPSKFFIKRIVGLPGETVTMQGGSITITNNRHPEGIVLDESYIVDFARDSFTVMLERDEYFVLGDNRPASSDSRIWGPLEEDLIIGRAFLRLLPIARAEVLPGEENQN